MKHVIASLKKSLTRILAAKHVLPLLAMLVVAIAITAIHALAGYGPPAADDPPASRPITPVANPCSRFTAGSIVQNPPALFSQNGVLSVNLSYQTTTDADGRPLYCFMTPAGLENPTLHVHPGDHLVINITNNTPATPVVLPINSPNCGTNDLTGSSVNIHFHGTNTSPTCHQDEVVHTLINSGQSFRYDVHFPAATTRPLLVPPTCTYASRGSPAGGSFRRAHRGRNSEPTTGRGPASSTDLRHS